MRALMFPLLALMAGPALADPCGLVPPARLDVSDGPGIERIGEQKTYAFYKDGMETLVIRPGFTGEVDEFGMLVPFPTPPAIRKVHDDTFAHIAAAVDPPKIDLVFVGRGNPDAGEGAKAKKEEGKVGKKDSALRYDEVRVLNQEAVGMYEVAVLEAGSSAALSRWMEENSFRYPEGMDATVDDYVALRWCFVAVKTKVGQMPGVTPTPGMRGVDTDLPAGSTFDGHVQGMGFRFATERLVIPMRLSTFNGDDLHNIVYVLTDDPVQLDGIDPELVRRQLPGRELYDNLTQPLSFTDRVDTGRVSAEWMAANADRLDPDPHNGIARELFAADLQAVRSGHLALAFEEEAKRMLNVSESLGLRGSEMDEMMRAAQAEAHEATLDRALIGLKGMTLTVIDGDFPKDFLRDNNLMASQYLMPRGLNTADHYQHGPRDIRIYYREPRTE